jgi:hypothetical protein
MDLKWMKGGSGMDIALKFKDEDSVNILAKQHQEDEAIIKAGLKAFFEVGSALMRIRDSKSYKDVDGYKTFDAYCKDKWDMGKSYAHEYISSAKVLDNLSGIPVIPTAVSQCRLIAGLNPKLQRKIWQAVINASQESGEKITAKLVQEVLEEICAPDPIIVEELRANVNEEEWIEKPKKKPTLDQAWKSFEKTFEEFVNHYSEPVPELKLDPKDQAFIKEFVTAGHRAMAKKYHPDIGGSVTDMARINAVKDLMMLTFQLG